MYIYKGLSRKLVLSTLIVFWVCGQHSHLCMLSQGCGLRALALSGIFHNSFVKGRSHDEKTSIKEAGKYEAPFDEEEIGEGRWRAGGAGILSCVGCKV